MSFADGKLKTISASGGPATTLCDAAVGPAGGTWNADGVILFAAQSSIFRVSQTGGACTVLSATGEIRRFFPQFLPDGRHFFYTQQGGPAAQGVYVASLDDVKGHRVLADQSSVGYLPPSAGNKPGMLVFLREGTLMAQPLDAATLQPTGDVVRVAEHASFSNSKPQMAASLSLNGILAYLANGDTAGAPSQISWGRPKGQGDRKGRNHRRHPNAVALSR